MLLWLKNALTEREKMIVSNVVVAVYAYIKKGNLIVRNVEEEHIAFTV
jgi:hypothetical protein